ncbi:aldo/keto reductase [Nocardia thailandica]
MVMTERQFGHGGPRVFPIGLGCMGLSSTYGAAADTQSTTLIEAAIERGVNHFDTADLYGRGHNEELVGRALGRFRGTVTIATKFGYRFADDTPGARRFVDSSGAWARDACDASLRRLRTDCIDLFYLHRKDPACPIEETVGAMAELVQRGKVRAIGLSEVSPETLRRAHAVHPVAAVQMEYSLFSREVEREMLATCRELGVVLVAYAPIGRGWLTGQLAAASALDSIDSRRAHPRFAAPAFARNRQLVARLGAVATDLGVTSTQAALAWLLAQGDDVVPIPGTRHIAHLRENLAAAEVRLSREQLERLSAAIPNDRIVGDRHNAANLRHMGN